MGALQLMLRCQQLDGELNEAELRYLEQDVILMEWSPEQAEGASRRAPPRGRSVGQQMDQVERPFLAAATQPLRGFLDASAGASLCMCSLSDAIGRMPDGEAERQYRSLVSQVPNPG